MRVGDLGGAHGTVVDGDLVRLAVPGPNLQFPSVPLPVRLSKGTLLGKGREAYNGVHEHRNPSCAPRRTGGRSPRPVRLLETLAGGRVPRPPLPHAPSLEGGTLLRRGR